MTTFRPTSLAGAVARYCDEYVSVRVSVCLSVCLSARISPEPHADTRDLNHIVLHVANGHGSVLRRRCDMLCTSGFADDIMFFL